MPQEHLNFMQRMSEYGMLGYLWILLISIWAGTVKYLTSLDGRQPTLFGWFVEIVISGFVGVVVAMTCQYFGADFLLTSAITGIAAHNGTRSIYLVGEVLRRQNPALSPIIDNTDSENKKAEEKE